MPLSVAQLLEPPSAGPPRASEREEPERLPGLSMRAKSSNTNISQRHLMQAERHRMCLQRKPIELCHPYQPHRGWHNVRCKQSGSRRPNRVHLAGLPHCQHAGVDCAWDDAPAVQRNPPKRAMHFARTIYTSDYKLALQCEKREKDTGRHGNKVEVLALTDGLIRKTRRKLRWMTSGTSGNQPSPGDFPSMEGSSPCPRFVHV